MNTIVGKIKAVENNNNISLVNCAINNQTVQAVVIGNKSTMNYLICNNEIELLINESEIAIAKDVNGLFSISNQLLCKITSINKGYFFSRIELDLQGQKVYSLVTTESCLRMELKKGDPVTALIKANEIFLKQKDKIYDTNPYI